jgi:hypothetical protein
MNHTVPIPIPGSYIDFCYEPEDRDDSYGHSLRVGGILKVFKE